MWFRVLAVVYSFLASGPIALTPGDPTNSHVTDGGFTGNEWHGPDTVVQSFNVLGTPNASFLYAAQGSQSGPNGVERDLYLMYDYVAGNPATFFGHPNATFDVLFQNGTDDYLVRIFGDSHPSIPSTQQDDHAGTDFKVFEKAHSDVSGTNPDGSLNPNSAPWSALLSTDPDFIKAHFVVAVGQGSSENGQSNHLMGEFQLSLNVPGTNGLYSPDPAFWSASINPVAAIVLGTSADPPIGSAIFTLDPNLGTTTFAPVLGPNGGPVTQQQDAAAVPEPTTILGWSLLAGMFAASTRYLRAPFRATRRT